MKVTLTLRKQIWNQESRKSALNSALSEVAPELEEFIKLGIDESDPQGRIYRLRTITGRFSARGVGNRRRGTSTRSVIGAEFYRASAPGQPPARRTSSLYRAIKCRRVGNTSIKASVDKKYAKYLDDPTILDRPFFRNRCRIFFKERFTSKVKESIRKLNAA